MDADAPTSPVPVSLLVLYADIVGSTALYERHGDEAALRAINTAVAILGDIVEREQGRVVKTIGDEILAVFDDPARGVMAGADMPAAVHRASKDGRIATGEMRLRVGMHFGPTIDEDTDLFGEGPITAGVVIKKAKADQVLATRETVRALPAALLASTRRVADVSVVGLSGSIGLFEVLWSDQDLTQVSDDETAEDPMSFSSLELSGGELREVCDAGNPRITIGREDGNDVVLDSDVTSRRHAEIELVGQRFTLIDQSVNGTRVLRPDGTRYSVHREQTVLGARGRICLGGTFESNPEATLSFTCR